MPQPKTQKEKKQQRNAQHRRKKNNSEMPNTEEKNNSNEIPNRLSFGGGLRCLKKKTDKVIYLVQSVFLFLSLLLYRQILNSFYTFLYIIHILFSEAAAHSSESPFWVVSKRYRL